MSARVGIVGGGVSGLRVLWRLARAGVDAVLFDEAPRVGGVIRTHRAEGYLVEAGPNTVVDDGAIGGFAAELGLGVRRADPRMPRFVFRRGRLEPVPLGLRSLVRSPVLSAAGKLRLLAEPFIRRGGTADESVAGFFRRRFGAEVAERLVAPLMLGIYAGDADRLEVASVFPRLAGLERERGSVTRGMLCERRGPRPSLLSFADGLEALPRRVAESLGPNLRLGTRVEAIRRDGRGFALDFRGGCERVDATVVATGAWGAAALLSALAPAAARALAVIPAPPLAVVSLAVGPGDLPHALRGFGFLAPRGEGLRVLGAVFASSLFSGRAPAGFATITAFAGGAVDLEVADLDDETVVRLVRADLASAVGLRAGGRVLALDRHRRSIPQYTIGHARRVAQIEASVAAVPGLHVAGNYLSGVSVGDCIRRADEVVERILRTVARAPSREAR